MLKLWHLKQTDSLGVHMVSTATEETWRQEWWAPSDQSWGPQWSHVVYLLTRSSTLDSNDLLSLLIASVCMFVAVTLIFVKWKHLFILLKKPKQGSSFLKKAFPPLPGFWNTQSTHKLLVNSSGKTICFYRSARHYKIELQRFKETRFPVEDLIFRFFFLFVFKATTTSLG